jgi:hypothetical protein
MPGASRRAGRSVLHGLIDLNPVRAGICETLRDSAHTSVRHRIESAQTAFGRALGRRAPDQALKTVAGLDVTSWPISQNLATSIWSAGPGYRPILTSEASCLPPR